MTLKSQNGLVFCFNVGWHMLESNGGGDGDICAYFHSARIHILPSRQNSHSQQKQQNGKKSFCMRRRKLGRLLLPSRLSRSQMRTILQTFDFKTDSKCWRKVVHKQLLLFFAQLY